MHMYFQECLQRNIVQSKRNKYFELPSSLWPRCCVKKLSNLVKSTSTLGHVHSGDQFLWLSHLYHHFTVCLQLTYSPECFTSSHPPSPRSNFRSLNRYLFTLLILKPDFSNRASGRSRKRSPRAMHIHDRVCHHCLRACQSRWNSELCC